MTLCNFTYRFSKLCTSSAKSGPITYKRAKVFRHIQLLTTLLNGCQKGTQILVIIFAPIFVFTFSLTMLVINRNVDFIFLTTLILMVVDCFLIEMVILGQMAMVYQKSSISLKSVTYVNSQICTKTKKWEHRFYFSCAPLKILISGTNFVDSFTPLTCLEVSITMTANVLMLN